MAVPGFLHEQAKGHAPMIELRNSTSSPCPLLHRVEPGRILVLPLSYVAGYSDLPLRPFPVTFSKALSKAKVSFFFLTVTETWPGKKKYELLLRT